MFTIIVDLENEIFFSYWFDQINDEIINLVLFYAVFLLATTSLPPELWPLRRSSLVIKTRSSSLTPDVFLLQPAQCACNSVMYVASVTARTHVLLLSHYLHAPSYVFQIVFTTRFLFHTWQINFSRRASWRAYSTPLLCELLATGTRKLCLKSLGV